MPRTKSSRESAFTWRVRMCGTFGSTRCRRCRRDRPGCGAAARRARRRRRARRSAPGRRRPGSRAARAPRRRRRSATANSRFSSVSSGLGAVMPAQTSTSRSARPASCAFALRDLFGADLDHALAHVGCRRGPTRRWCRRRTRRRRRSRPGSRSGRARADRLRSARRASSTTVTTGTESPLRGRVSSTERSVQPPSALAAPWRGRGRDAASRRARSWGVMAAGAAILHVDAPDSGQLAALHVDPGREADAARPLLAALAEAVLRAEPSSMRTGCCVSWSTHSEGARVGLERTQVAASEHPAIVRALHAQIDELPGCRRSCAARRRQPAPWRPGAARAAAAGAAACSTARPPRVTR